jgi:hypothetical protein
VQRLGQNVSCIKAYFRRLWRSKTSHHVTVGPYGYSPFTKNYSKLIQIKYCPWKCTNRVITRSLKCYYSPWCIQGSAWILTWNQPTEWKKKKVCWQQTKKLWLHAHLGVASSYTTHVTSCPLGCILYYGSFYGPIASVKAPLALHQKNPWWTIWCNCYTLSGFGAYIN